MNKNEQFMLATIALLSLALGITTVLLIDNYKEKNNRKKEILESVRLLQELKETDSFKQASKEDRQIMIDNLVKATLLKDAPQ